MALSHRDTETASGSTSAVVTKPTGTVDGDLLLAMVVSVDSNIGAPAGWSSIRNTLRTSGTYLRTFSRVASGEGSTFTFSGTTATRAIVSCFTGFAGTPTLDVESGSNNASSVNICAPTVTTTTNNELLFFASTNATGSTTTTPPSGMTEPTNGDVASCEVAYLLDAGTAGATGDETATGSSAGANAAHLAAFKDVLSKYAPPPFRRPITQARM